MNISALLFICLFNVFLKSQPALAIPQSDYEPGESNEVETSNENQITALDQASNRSVPELEWNPHAFYDTESEKNVEGENIAKHFTTIDDLPDNKTLLKHSNVNTLEATKTNANKTANLTVETYRNATGYSEQAITTIEKPIPNLDEPLSSLPDWLVQKGSGIMQKSYYTPNSYFNPLLIQSRLPEMIVAMSNIQQDLQDHIARNRIVFEDIYGRLHATKTGLKNTDSRITSDISKTNEKLTSNLQQFEQDKSQSNIKFQNIKEEMERLDQHLDWLKSEVVKSHENAKQLHKDQKLHIDTVETRITSLIKDQIASINDPNRVKPKLSVGTASANEFRIPSKVPPSAHYNIPPPDFY